MMRSAGFVALLLLGLGAASFGRKDETLKELLARADAAPADHKPELYMEAAERQMKAGNEALKASQSEQFLTALNDVVQFCDKASQTASQSNKHVKNVEIKIRRISAHLRDIKLDADPDDQPKVQAAIDKLESIRTELLRKMFGGKS